MPISKSRKSKYELDTPYRHRGRRDAPLEQSPDPKSMPRDHGIPDLPLLPRTRARVARRSHRLQAKADKLDASLPAIDEDLLAQLVSRGAGTSPTVNLTRYLNSANSAFAASSSSASASASGSGSSSAVSSTSVPSSSNVSGAGAVSKAGPSSVAGFYTPESGMSDEEDEEDEDEDEVEHMLDIRWTGSSADARTHSLNNVPGPSLKDVKGPQAVQSALQDLSAAAAERKAYEDLKIKAAALEARIATLQATVGRQAHSISEVLMCPICYELMVRPRVYTHCLHVVCEECIEKVRLRQIKRLVFNPRYQNAHRIGFCVLCKCESFCPKEIHYIKMAAEELGRVNNLAFPVRSFSTFAWEVNDFKKRYHQTMRRAPAYVSFKLYLQGH
ncbi:hypothetical protein EIP91_009175 [Steccherinum ochraceum]|uniref:RING-type domain-containing protein n=1 Tax=Steccherinum ochraceum TaxID=92696 RepID=A0A4R0R7J0_9APHY|nr:hypothetical protein EIP91_009175 [Steccherinum ochraceum]